MKFLDLDGLKTVIDKILFKVQPYIGKVSTNKDVSFKTTHQIVLIDNDLNDINISAWFNEAPIGSMLEFIVVSEIWNVVIICFNSAGTQTVLTKIKMVNDAATLTTIPNLEIAGNSYARIMKYSDSQALVINDTYNNE
jgi:hypothetical protein